jgi:hypothetical protein
MECGEVGIREAFWGMTALTGDLLEQCDRPSESLDGFPDECAEANRDRVRLT